MEPHRGRGVLKVGLLAAALLLALGPALASACTLPDGTTAVESTVVGVLTETVERVDNVPTDDGEVHRVATAKEVGTVTAGCGTSLAPLIGAIKVQPALSDVLVFSPVSPNPALNTGPITGSVKFYPAAGGGVIKAALTGTLDFNPALVQRMPFVTISGQWTGTNSSLSGGVVGVALLPVAAADLGGGCLATTGFCYVDVTGALSGVVGTLVPLTIDEAQPAPSAKFIVTIFK